MAEHHQVRNWTLRRSEGDGSPERIKPATVLAAVKVRPGSVGARGKL